jgi:uncharacterized protein YneF (UPF0154 family)
MVDEKKVPELNEHSWKSQPRRRQIILQIIVGVIIFISGIVVGSGGTVALLKNRVIWIHRHPRIEAAHIAKEIASQYGLKDEQTQRVEQIFNSRFQTRTTIRQEYEAKMETENQKLVAEMKEILSPEQFQRWNKDFEARHEQHKKTSDSKM